MRRGTLKKKILKKRKRILHMSKKKKEKAYLPRLGYSQPQLDLFTVHDEADLSNVPEDPSSPHGSALTAIKRAKLYRREKLESLAPASKLGQAELDALCVAVGSDEDDAEPSPQGKALTTIKKRRSYGNIVEPMMPVPTMGTNQAELDALCVDAEDDDEEVPGSPGSLTKNNESEEEQESWSPFGHSPRRSATNSPQGERGHRSPSPVHGGA